MDLEGVTLGELSQRKTNTTWFHLHVEPKKKHQQQQTGDKLLDAKNKLTGARE